MPEVVEFGCDAPTSGFQIVGEQNVIDPCLGHILLVYRGLVVVGIQVSTHEKIGEGVTLGEFVDSVSQSLGVLQAMRFHVFGRGSGFPMIVEESKRYATYR